MKIDGNLKVMQ